MTTIEQLRSVPSGYCPSTSVKLYWARKNGLLDGPLPLDDMRLAWKRYYAHQSNAAKGRKDRTGTVIEFRLSFKEWLQLWLDSGHWHERGARRGGYVMARVGDLGHYEVGNVFIQRHEDNIAQANERKQSVPQSVEARARISAAMSGRKRDPAAVAKGIKKRQENGWTVTEEQRARWSASAKVSAAKGAATRKARGWLTKDRQTPLQSLTLLETSHERPHHQRPGPSEACSRIQQLPSQRTSRRALARRQVCPAGNRENSRSSPTASRGGG